MLYVSELQSDVFGQVPELIYLLNSVDKIGSAVVCDTESSHSETIGIRQLNSWEVLGVGATVSKCEGAVVCHNKKTALVYKHIESVRTEFGAQVLHAGFMTRKGFVRGCASDDGLAFTLSTGDSVYEILGCTGSACIVPGSVNNRSKVCTLYDLLGTLCKESGFNLLRYRTLHILNDYRRVTTTIKFKNCVEADRYRTKMYLDVMKP